MRMKRKESKEKEFLFRWQERFRERQDGDINTDHNICRKKADNYRIR